MPANPAIINSASPDLAIAGAGIVGLWAALKAAEAGLRVVLIDAAQPGAGASGGLVGALMPHQPSGWSPKKALQLDGLMTLPDEIGRLEASTGLSAGYARTARVMPVWSEAERLRHGAWAQGAAQHWPEPFQWQTPAPMPDERWLAPAAAPFGVAIDTLAARLNPRAMVALLVAALARLHPDRVEMRFGQAVSQVTADCALLLNDGNRISAKNVLIATGINAFHLVAPIVRRNIGSGVKGQAALLRPQNAFHPSSLPVIYADGLYIVAHADGTVAVGSTSENTYSDPFSTDGQLNTLVRRAISICPLLRDADIVERWAGVRPKHESRDPVVVPLPDAPRIIAALGAFKIGFGIAHLMGAEAVGHVTGKAGAWREVLAAGWRG
jgi:glycine oxidase